MFRMTRLGLLRRRDNSRGTSAWQNTGDAMANGQEMTSDTLRANVVAALREAASAHQCGAFNDIGEAFDRLAHQASQVTVDDSDLWVAIVFLDGWYDSSNHAWAYYEPLGKHDWPRLALSLADSLEAGRPIDEDVKRLFTPAPRRSLWARLRQLLR